MNKWRKGGKPAMLLLALALVFLAGCQAVGGFDFNQALKQSLKVTSGESNQTTELSLLLNEKAYEGLTEEEASLLKMFSQVKLELTNVKAQDERHASLDGKLIFGTDKSVAFSLAMSENTAVLELEGAKQPFVLDLTGEAFGAPADGAEPGAAEPVDDATMTEIGHRVIDAVGGYAIDNLPNPEKLSVSTVSEAVYGETVSLFRVQAELNGPDIWAWIKKYVDALAADREGLDAMLSGVVAALTEQPGFWESLGVPNPLEDPQLDAPTPEETVKQLGDKIAEALAGLQEQLKAAEADAEALKQVFNENTYVKADLYFDKKLDIRKENIEISFKPQGELGESLFPLDGFVLKTSTERWNVNGEVKAEAPAASETAVPAETLFSGQGYKLLQQFDENSVIYDILKNKLHVGKQEVYLYTDDFVPPIVTPANVTIVPLRYLAEELGASVEYDGKTKTIRVADEATGTTIELKNGSAVAKINGKNVKWPFPVTTVDGSVYVPARSFAAALGASLHWESMFEDGTNDTLVVTREL